MARIIGQTRMISTQVCINTCVPVEAMEVRERSRLVTTYGCTGRSQVSTTPTELYSKAPGTSAAIYPNRALAPPGHTGRTSEVTVRIIHQTRTWFNGPWRLGERVWSAVVLALGGCRGDGDVEAEGPELAEAGADLAVAVGVSVVPAGAEVGEPGPGSFRR